MKINQHTNLIKDLMHFPVVSVGVEDSIREVESVFKLYNMSILPVLAKEEPVGLITRNIVEKAIHHKLEEDSVEELMIRSFSVTKSDEYLSSVIPIVIKEGQKLIPVVNQANKIVGVVSRDDILRVIKVIESGKRNRILGQVDDQKDIESLLKKRLGQELLILLERISQTAEKFGVSVYMVGGFVRDLLLNVSNKDIDIVVEGNGIEFASVLVDELGGKVKSHQKFGTSVVILPDENRIDVATARLEHYDHPAALPTIKQSSVKDDLFRRDFTINSIAVKLNGDGAFSLMDLFNGERDLNNGEINVLHNLSFIEDPCRLFRSVRFEQRFGFKISKQTEVLMKVAIKKKLVDFLSGTRLLNEIILILKEKHPLRCILRMQELALLQLVSPQMVLSPTDIVALEKIEALVAWTETISLPDEPEIWYVYFLAIFYSLQEDSFSQTIDRLQVPARLKKSLKQDRIACKEGLAHLKNDMDWKPEKIYNLFSNFSMEAIIYFLAIATTDRVTQYANIYFTQYYRRAKLSLTGDDLLEMGMEPGPVFQSVFKALREAHIKGEIETREEEVALVRKQFL